MRKRFNLFRVYKAITRVCISEQKENPLGAKTVYAATGELSRKTNGLHTLKPDQPNRAFEIYNKNITDSAS